MGAEMPQGQPAAAVLDLVWRCRVYEAVLMNMGCAEGGETV